MTPLTVLGGYLGAGKTTIINGLLNSLAEQSSNPRIAVLVNDFGSINIDARLIRKHRGRTFEMSSGCVCCDIRDDLGGALDAIRTESFDQVLIEASGVAYPAKVANYATTWPGYRPAGILVAVDTINFNRQKDDKFIGHLVRQQIAEADLLLLTKLDQLTSPNIHTMREAMQKRAVRVDHGCCDLDILLASVNNPTDASERIQVTPRVTNHHDQFHSLTYQTNQLFDHRRIERFLGALPESVVRAKGWLRDTEGAWWLQSVGDRWSLEPADAPPDGTTMVFIMLTNQAIEQTKSLIESELLACLSEGNPAR